jgi:hypothetical protein
MVRLTPPSLVSMTNNRAGMGTRISAAGRADDAEDSHSLILGETVFRASTNVRSNRDL